MMNHLEATSFFVLVLALSASAQAQGRPDSDALMSAQRQAMQPLAFMDGVWRGTAWTLLPSGEKHTITQTERIGPFLDGTVKVIEGRGYDADGNCRSTPSERSRTIRPRAALRCTRTREVALVILF